MRQKLSLYEKALEKATIKFSHSEKRNESLNVQLSAFKSQILSKLIVMSPNKANKAATSNKDQIAQLDKLLFASSVIDATTSSPTKADLLADQKFQNLKKSQDLNDLIVANLRESMQMRGTECAVVDASSSKYNNLNKQVALKEEEHAAVRNGFLEKIVGGHKCDDCSQPNCSCHSNSNLNIVDANSLEIEQSSLLNLNGKNCLKKSDKILLLLFFLCYYFKIK